MSRPLTVGILGHVDHGKTALVRRLTGIETDRLAEERERGLSIVLGFAYLDTGHGIVDLIDVPGHENFVRAMISGATALDAVLLVVAANEGVMPQTVEHFNIARLLGIERGGIVLTKTDLVDDETRRLASGEIAELVAGTFLDGAPIIDASAETGQGIESVREYLAGLVAGPTRAAAESPVFMPLDRFFTMRGFGLVVTGSLRGGPLRVGDAVEIQPGGHGSTVRGLQNHNEAVDCVSPGQRVAVNLRHLDRRALARGDVLAAPGTVRAARLVDAGLNLLDGAPGPLRNGTTLRLLTGTAEAIARVRLLDRRVVEPGDSAIAQFTLDRDVATRSAERFVIRTFSPPRTIGGGTILDVDPKRHQRFDRAVARRLETAATGDLDLIVAQRLDEAGVAGVRPAGLANELATDPKAVLGALERAGMIAIDDDLGASRAAIGQLELRIIREVTAFHEAEPYLRGIDAGTLAQRLETEPHPKIMRHAIRTLVAAGKLDSRPDGLSLAGHDPLGELSAGQRRLAVEMENVFLTSGIAAPSPETVVGDDRRRRDIHRLLLETGRLVRLRTYGSGSPIVMHSDVVEHARQAIERRYPPPETFALKDIRDLLGSTRKYIVPLMEHFDATGVTQRSGDLRRLRER